MLQSNPPSDGHSCVLKILSEIAEREQKDVTELPPLYDRIDGDALTRLVGEERSSQLRLTFTYCGREIEVRGDGTAFVEGERVDDRERVSDGGETKNGSVQP